MLVKAILIFAWTGSAPKNRRYLQLNTATDPAEAKGIHIVWQFERGVPAGKIALSRCSRAISRRAARPSRPGTQV
jgi:hypothetical protein